VLVTLWLLLTKGRGNTVLASVWNPEATLAMLLGLVGLLPRNLWVMAHGNEVMAYPKTSGRYALKGWLRRRVLHYARGVICNSHYTEQLVKSLAPSANTLVINPGVDSRQFAVTEGAANCRHRFTLPEGKRLLLSVSRLDRHKGHDLVLRALSAMTPEDRQRLHYVVAGKGDQLIALQQLAKTLAVAEQVTWLGYVADADLPYLYKAADLFVLCTREDPESRGVEGFGMVFLEAQAAGLPVVGTRAGGIPDAIAEGEGGWLIPQDDIDALAAHLRRLAANSVDVAEQGQLGQRRVARSGSWQYYVNTLEAAIERP
jgi:phosphatidylinositol alpha-1,6-mannosyltransferase